MSFADLVGNASRLAAQKKTQNKKNGGASISVRRASTVPTRSSGGLLASMVVKSNTLTTTSSSASSTKPSTTTPAPPPCHSRDQWYKGGIEEEVVEEVDEKENHERTKRRKTSTNNSSATTTTAAASLTTPIKSDLKNAIKVDDEDEDDFLMDEDESKENRQPSQAWYNSTSASTTAAKAAPLFSRSQSSPIKSKQLHLVPNGTSGIKIKQEPPTESKKTTTLNNNPTPPVLQCMLCGISLALVPLDERNKHINHCLDMLTNGSPPTAATSTSPSTPGGLDSLKRKRPSDDSHDLNEPHPPSNQRPKLSASSNTSSSPPEVCVIDDDHDLPGVCSTTSTIAATASSTTNSSSSASSSVRRAITDFFGMKHGGKAPRMLSTSSTTIATPTPSSRSHSRNHAKSNQMTKSAPTKQTLPVPSSRSQTPTPTSAPTSATTDNTSISPAPLAVTVDSTASATFLAAEKTKDVWNLLLTGKASGTMAPMNLQFGRGKSNEKSGASSSSSSSGWNGGGGQNGAARSFKLPSFKLLPQTNILIDAFMHTKAALSTVPNPLWFLSHFHSDHYMGLSSTWNGGTVYCSPITARLARQTFGAKLSIIPLPLHERIEIGAVRVTLIDAHHCPGAVIFIFETPPLMPTLGVNYSFLPPELQQQRRQEEKALAEKLAAESTAITPDITEINRKRLAGQRHGKVYVHGGDMRYHPSMRDLFVPAHASVPHHFTPPTAPATIAPSLQPHLPSTYVPCEYPSLAFKAQLSFLHDLTIDTVYLDTTYCNPRYRFPSQAFSIAHSLSVVGECLTREKRFGVSALVDKQTKKSQSSPLTSFFKQFTNSPTTAANPGSSSHTTASTSVPTSSASAAASTTSSSVDEGLAAFLTQTSPIHPPTTTATAVTTTNESNGDEQNALDEIDQFFEATERQEEDEEMIDPDQSETHQRDSSSANNTAVDAKLVSNDDQEDDETRHDQDPLNSETTADEEELEDLMLRDYDRPLEEDDAQMDEFDPTVVAASSVSHALSSVWSTVSSSVNSLQRNLALSTSFLGGYKQQAISKTLFLVGSYSIGKEKIFIEIAKQYGLKIYVPAYRLRTMKLLDLFDEDTNTATTTTTTASTSASTTTSSPSKVSTHFSAPAPAAASIHREWSSWSMSNVVTTKITEARLHVIPLSQISHKSIGEHLDPTQNKAMPGDYIKQFHQVVAFRPTGWVGNKPTMKEETIRITIPPPTRLVRDTTPQPRTSGGRGGKAKMIPIETGPATKHALTVAIHGVPYSEHSTFPELNSFVETLAACGLSEIIPTVNIATCREMVNNTWGHLLQQPTSSIIHQLNSKDN